MAHSHRRPDLFFLFALQIKPDENFPIAGWQCLEDSRCDFLSLQAENALLRILRSVTRQDSALYILGLPLAGHLSDVPAYLPPGYRHGIRTKSLRLSEGTLLNETNKVDYETVVGIFGALRPNLVAEKESNRPQRLVQFLNCQITSSSDPHHDGSPG